MSCRLPGYARIQVFRYRMLTKAPYVLVVLVNFSAAIGRYAKPELHAPRNYCLANPKSTSTAFISA
jgi:hypothetical protein